MRVRSGTHIQLTKSRSWRQCNDDRFDLWLTSTHKPSGETPVVNFGGKTSPLQSSNDVQDRSWLSDSTTIRATSNDACSQRPYTSIHCILCKDPDLQSPSSQMVSESGSLPQRAVDSTSLDLFSGLQTTLITLSVFIQILICTCTQIAPRLLSHQVFA